MTETSSAQFKMNYFETQAGYDFATHTVPRLIQAIEENTKALEASRQAPPPCSFCPSCTHFNNGRHCAVCADCVKDHWYRFEYREPNTKKECDEIV